MKWHWTLALAVATSWAAGVSAAPEKPAPAENSSFGTIVGKVTSPSGTVQGGIPVVITRRDGPFEHKVYTEASGRFRLPHLAPGIYAAEVLLPSALPFMKAPIIVRAGAEILLDINLRSLTDSLEIQWPENPAEAREEWKWVLRSAYPPRPILRFQESDERPGMAAQDPRERALRGVIQFLAGNESQGFARNPGLLTSFDMEYGGTGANLLGVAGSAGWERDAPAASLRTSWTRHPGEGNRSTVSATIRQLFLPSQYWRGVGKVPGQGAEERLESLTFGYEQEMESAWGLRLQYGTLFDTLAVGNRINRWSPFGRLIYEYSDSTQLQLVFTAVTPRVLPSEEPLTRQRIEQWLAIPQISSGAGLQPVVEGGKHLEAAWEHQEGPYRVLAAAFYDSLANAALSLAGDGSNTLLGGVLRDPFSNRRFLSGGHYSGPGVRASLGVKFTKDDEVMVGYSYAENLHADSQELLAETPQALRAMIQPGRGHSFVAKIISTVPWMHTQVITSYRWLPRNAVVANDPYDQSFTQSEPYLNVILLQPIPSPGILPGQFQAMANFTNLLAQGYLAVQSPDGRRTLLFPTARSFRCGFNFIF